MTSNKMRWLFNGSYSRMSYRGRFLYDLWTTTISASVLAGFVWWIRPADITWYWMIVIFVVLGLFSAGYNFIRWQGQVRGGKSELAPKPVPARPQSSFPRCKMNSHSQSDKSITLKNSILSRCILVMFLVPILLAGCYWLANEITTQPVSSALLVIFQVGALAMALASGWSWISYDQDTISSYIPLGYRETVFWDDVNAYRIGWLEHSLLQDGHTVLRVPALSQTRMLWDECERRGVNRAP